MQNTTVPANIMQIISIVFIYESSVATVAMTKATKKNTKSKISIFWVIKIRLNGKVNFSFFKCQLQYNVHNYVFKVIHLRERERIKNKQNCRSITSIYSKNSVNNFENVSMTLYRFVVKSLNLSTKQMIFSCFIFRLFFFSFLLHKLYPSCNYRFQRRQNDSNGEQQER